MTALAGHGWPVLGVLPGALVDVVCTMILACTQQSTRRALARRSAGLGAGIRCARPGSLGLRSVGCCSRCLAPAGRDGGRC